MPIVDEILKTEYSKDFDEKRKLLMCQSFYKYGHVRLNFANDNVDAIVVLEKCLEKFKETGNTEYLMDVANYAMIRHMYPKKGEFFKNTESSGSAGYDGISEKEIKTFNAINY